MKKTAYFTIFEKLLWGLSSLAVILSFFLPGGGNLLSLIASLIGVTFLILNAKGNPLGQLLTIVFSVLYGIISFSCAYYGEMITYLGMSAPMALFALISWIRHPFKGGKSQVEVGSISPGETALMLALTAVVTVIFYFILSALGNANLIPATLSVTTSFLAAYLSARRSPYFALAYASNDLVLIILWALAWADNREYVSVLVCFIVFFINDMYGFASWLGMRKKQAQSPAQNG